MEQSTSETASVLEQVFCDALNAVLSEYEARTFAPLTEADVQSQLYGECLSRLRSLQMTPYPLHVNWRLSSRPSGLERAKFDLILGKDLVVVEIKFEADYPGVSKPVCFSNEIAKDVVRLQEARRHGVAASHFVFIDEDGTHRRNLHKHVSLTLPWRELSRADRKPAHLLHLPL